MEYINHQNFTLTIVNGALMFKVLLRKKPFDKWSNSFRYQHSSGRVVAYKLLQELIAALTSHFLSSIYELM